MIVKLMIMKLQFVPVTVAEALDLALTVASL